MANLEEMYVEFLVGVAELEVLAHAERRNNTRWRGQEREGGPIDLGQLENDSWKTYFRFGRDEVERLAIALQIPESVVCDNRIVEKRVTALCMLLARLSSPNRLSDLYLKFGWKPERVSRVVNTLLSYIYEKWKHLLKFDTTRLTPERLASYTIAVRNRDAPLETCFGFVDGTLRPIARPTHSQDSLYNGWKRIHALKYQAIVTPDGIIPHLYGPVEGRMHDAAIWAESGMAEILEAYAYAPNGQKLQVYGDPAYGISENLISPFQGAAIARDEREWNKAMSKVRIVVEWCFKEVLQLFGFLDFTKSQQILLSPIGLQYPVAVLLHNAHVCLHRPQISQYFTRENNIDIPVELGEEEMPQLAEPPTLEQYFHTD